MGYLSITLSITNILGLIISLLGLVILFLSNIFANIISKKKYKQMYNNEDISEEEKLKAFDTSREMRRYREKVCLIFKIIAVILVIIAGIIVFIIK